MKAALYSTFPPFLNAPSKSYDLRAIYKPPSLLRSYATTVATFLKDVAARLRVEGEVNAADVIERCANHAPEIAERARNDARQRALTPVGR